MKNPILINRLLSLTILGGSLFIFPQAVQATVADGVHAYEKGNYKQARQEWLPYAALGNTNALYNLGQLYRMARGVEADYTKAEEYYLRAAGRGHVGAQRNLGTLYYFGRTGKVDHIKAFNWLLKSASNGDPRSQLMVGTMYFNGEATEKNNVEAYAWILLASESGLRNATEALEQMKRAMEPDQIKEAKSLTSNMISRQLSPDDAGLMVNHQDANTIRDPKLDNREMAAQTAKLPKTTTLDPGSVEAGTMPPASEGVADNYRVQLGSFRSEAVAQKALEALMEKHSLIIEDSQGTVEFAELGEMGIYYRLQLSPFETKSAARDLCSQLKENGQACYVVKAR